MGVIPFEDVSISSGVNFSYSLKNNSVEVLNELNNINENSNISIEDALKIANEVFEENDGGKNNRLVQYLVIVADNFSNENICRNGNTILKNMDDKMVVMYGAFIGISETASSNVANLFNNVKEIIVANDLSVTGLRDQLNNNVMSYINQTALKTTTLIPVNEGNNSAVMANRIVFSQIMKYYREQH